MNSVRMALLAGLIAASAGAARAQLTVSGTSPLLNASNVPTTSSISVTFDRAVDRTTFTPANFGAFAKWSGPVNGPVTFSNGDQTVTLTPARDFLAGESVMLVMSHGLRAADGTFMRAAGYTLAFMTAAAPTAGEFVEREVLTDRDESGATTRIYGGVACDLDLDGWADMTLVNEISADLRVFLNRGDGSGQFQPMLMPPTPIPHESSPNEPADFNRDGFVDIVTSSNATNEIAIAFGNGDGTFDPPVIIDVGSYPRGFGILDADGDGDMDITVANAFSNTIALLVNDGSGNFGAPSFFSSVEDGPYGMTAADMNNDGIQDLVVGFVNSQRIRTFLGNGNGTFSVTSQIRSIGGANWVLVVGDLNGDRKLDASAANSVSGTAATLLGNGDGTFQPASVKNIGGHTTATDLADIDGDGDLDWIVSCFGCSRWDLYLNNGMGVFTFERDFDAVGNPACALPADFDNDGDVDLALLDETADLIYLMENVGGGECVADFDGNGILNVFDFLAFQTAFSTNDPRADLDGNGLWNVFDFLAFQSAFSEGC